MISSERERETFLLLFECFHLPMILHNRILAVLQIQWKSIPKDSLVFSNRITYEYHFLLVCKQFEIAELFGSHYEFSSNKIIPEIRRGKLMVYVCTCDEYISYHTSKSMNICFICRFIFRFSFLNLLKTKLLSMWISDFFTSNRVSAVKSALYSMLTSAIPPLLARYEYFEALATDDIFIVIRWFFFNAKSRIVVST